jgi:putative peptidoglycan lipid II flippase
MSSPSIPSSERGALARLEELGDVLAIEQERNIAPPDPGQDASEAAMPRPRAAGLLRSNLVVAAGTTLSRVTGLLRVMVFAYVIGKGALADAYLIGNETPNIVYELLLGGVLSATLVPLFTSFLHHRDDGTMDEDEAGAHATNVVITVTMVAVTVLTAVAFLGAPLIFGLYTINAEGRADPATLREVGTLLTRVFLLQIFFYGMTGLLSAYLNARRRFFAAAWSPIVPNLVIIVTLLTVRGQPWQLDDVLTNQRLRWTLGLGATAGIASMAVLLAIAVRHAGLRFRPSFELRHPAIRTLVTLSTWTLGYVACNQLVTIVIRNLSGPGSGDSAAYFQAFTFFVLPHGLLAVSIATTFEPEMAIAVHRRDKVAFIDRTSLGVRLIALLTLPAAVLLFVLRRPLIGLLLEHGEYSALDALITSRTLGGFALGLVGFSAYLFTFRGFYAHQDTRTPFVINVGQCALNVALAFAFVHWWGVLGLAAAYAVSYVLAAAWALQVMSYKVPGFPVGGVFVAIARMVLAAALAAEATWFVARHVGTNTGAGALGRLVAGTIVGLGTYALALVLLKAPEVSDVARLVPGRRPSGDVANAAQ